MIYRLINKKGIGLTGNTKKRTKPHKDSCRDIASAKKLYYIKI
jgi:hypothetical protein